MTFCVIMLVQMIFFRAYIVTRFTTKFWCFSTLFSVSICIHFGNKKIVSKVRIRGFSEKAYANNTFFAISVSQHYAHNRFFGKVAGKLKL
jgi:hypothetical protein